MSYNKDIGGASSDIKNGSISSKDVNSSRARAKNKSSKNIDEESKKQKVESEIDATTISLSDPYEDNDFNIYFEKSQHPNL